MKVVIAILGLLMSFSAVAQRNSKIEVEQGRNENFWRNHVLRLEKEVQLSDVATAAQSFYLRFWMDGTVLDVWQEKKSLQGSLTNWVKEQVPTGEEETGRYFVVRETLDSALCQKVYLSYQNRQLEALPSEERIVDWQQGFDGITYILESVNNDTYWFKSYWTPTAQGDLQEAAQVQGFVGDVAQVLNLQKRQSYFNTSIPFVSWTTGNGTSVSRVMARTEYYRMKKERDRYRRLAKQQKL
jgi:hypothetical protein